MTCAMASRVAMACHRLTSFLFSSITLTMLSILAPSAAFPALHPKKRDITVTVITKFPDSSFPCCQWSPRVASTL
ncbi:hypothetical protein CGRA01v4_11884 [Colletotrichum graminicola]|nr:hypothetical protein CGRA01v4_11884 [Colletotrichum graminicola]